MAQSGQINSTTYPVMGNAHYECYIGNVASCVYTDSRGSLSGTYLGLRASLGQQRTLGPRSKHHEIARDFSSALLMKHLTLGRLTVREHGLLA